MGKKKYIKHNYPEERVVGRLIDLLLFLCIINLITAILPKLVKIYIYINASTLIIMILMIWVIVETILICTWSTTIGKNFFGIKIVDDNNNNLSFFKAFNRSYHVWVKALMFGIPIIFASVGVKSYKRLDNGRKTYWDEKAGTKLIVLKNQSNRLLAGTGIIVGLIILNYVIINISLSSI